MIGLAIVGLLVLGGIAFVVFRKTDDAKPSATEPLPSTTSTP
jgi:hypothetical protein